MSSRIDRVDGRDSIVCGEYLRKRRSNMRQIKRFRMRRAQQNHGPHATQGLARKPAGKCPSQRMSSDYPTSGLRLIRHYGAGPSMALTLCCSSGAILYGSATTNTGWPFAAIGRSMGAYASGATPAPTMNTSPDNAGADLGTNARRPSERCTATFAALTRSAPLTPRVR